MNFDRYLDSLRNDAALLGTTAGMASPRPSRTPGLDRDRVVDHVSAVYQHKIARMRLGHAPGAMPEPRPGDPVDRMTASLGELLVELTTRAPAATS
jgi:hypothetical protein